MKPWIVVTLALVVPGGCLLGAALWLRQQWIAYQWREQPNYVAAIQGWRPDRELALPPIRALKAQRVHAWSSRRFHQRGRA